MNRLGLLFIFVFLSQTILQGQHISEFISLEGGTQSTDLILPSTHSFQYIIETGDAYNGGGTLPAKFDFTGYVPISGSSQNGYLSVSHELTPGGLSILDVQFDPGKQSWSYSNAHEVDFTVVNGTGKNCSGTVTPWNTIVTSEEITSIDNNGDGYYDLGWNIEVDPVTKQILDYPGGLSGGDKMWALGNFKHENIAIQSNLRTVYQAEDINGGHLYKFVADMAGDLSSGDLYVYVGPKNGNGNWVQLDNNTPAQQNTTIAQADAVGATDFNGGEDVEINPINGKICFAVKNEACVYCFDDDDPLSGGTVSNFEIYVGDMSYDLTTENGTSTVPWGNGNDNLCFDDLGNLWVLQDGSDNHIWVVEDGHTQSSPKVKIFGRTPAGCEPTGMTLTPDQKYLFMSIQHPSASNNSTSQEDAFQNQVFFDKDVAIVIARKEFLGNCHQNININYTHNAMDSIHVGCVLNSSALLSATSDVTYFAGDTICLPIDFEVSTGAEFYGNIIDCVVNQP